MNKLKEHNQVLSSEVIFKPRGDDADVSAPGSPASPAPFPCSQADAGQHVVWSYYSPEAPRTLKQRRKDKTDTPKQRPSKLKPFRPARPGVLLACLRELNANVGASPPPAPSPPPPESPMDDSFDGILSALDDEDLRLLSQAATVSKSPMGGRPGPGANKGVKFSRHDSLPQERHKHKEGNSKSFTRHSTMPSCPPPASDVRKSGVSSVCSQEEIRRKREAARARLLAKAAHTRK